AFVPADARPHQEPVVGRKIFQRLAELGFEALGGQPHGVVEQLRERRALEGRDPELGQNLLLPDAQAQRAAVGRGQDLAIRRHLDDGLLGLGWRLRWRHWASRGLPRDAGSRTGTYGAAAVD